MQTSWLLLGRGNEGETGGRERKKKKGQGEKKGKGSEKGGKEKGIKGREGGGRYDTIRDAILTCARKPT